jgi:FG-GAP-like repeat/FG-GAP repeat
MRSRKRKNLLSAALISGLAVIFLMGVAVRATAQYKIYDLGYNVRTQDIQADNTNAVHIVWTDSSIIYYGKIVNNAITGKVEVGRGINSVYWRPYVSVQPDGSSVHIAWTTGGMGNMLMHSWKTTGEWKTESVLSVPSTQWLCQPTCAVDSRGIVHVMFVIWNNVSNGWSTIFYMRKLADGKWESKQQFAPLQPEYKHPMLINDSQGRIHATWTLMGRSGEDSYDAYYCTAPSGSKLAYTNRVKLPKAEDCDVNGYGDLYVDRYGAVHRSIGGWSNAQQKMCIDHTRKPVGKNFLTPTRASLGFLYLTAGDPVPAVVAREDGKAVVAWGEIGSGGSNTVKASFYDPDRGAWSVYTVDPAAGIPTTPNSYRVAVTRTDTHVYGVWRGGNGHLKLLVMPIDANIKKDFNSDGKADILWRHYGTGSNRIWYMDNLKKIGESELPAALDIKWEIVGMGDFNGDGKVDILWRHSVKGSNWVWYMSGAKRTGQALLPTVEDPNMKIGGTGDFNRDGKMDILWRNQSTGENTVWYMDGVTLIGEGLLPELTSLSWKIGGTGDFNRDGKVDILWRNSNTGSNWVWFIDGIKRIGGGLVEALTDTNWDIAGTGDFNGDGKVDILWRNSSTGANQVWYMDNLKHIGGGSVPSETDVIWKIENQ